MKHFLLSLSLLWILSALVCGQVANQQKATVYFYRLEEGSVWESKKPKIHIDNKEIATLQKNRFFKVTLSPGKYIIRAQQKSTEIPLAVEAGKEYYIRATQTVGGYFYNQGLSQVAAEQAVFDLKKTQPLEAKHIKDRSMVSAKQ